MTTVGSLHQVPQRVLMALVRFYRFAFSPWLGSACRFEPTCSAYALQALERHGAAAGSFLTLHRLCRCQPLAAGGFDPVSDQPPTLFRHLASGFAKPEVMVSTLPLDKKTP